jgi:hypothetical protein
VTFVPGCERDDDDARVDGDQRRDLSRVSRTISSVSGGSESRGTATIPTLLASSDIGVGAGSISRRPFRSRRTSGSPATKLQARVARNVPKSGPTQ